MKALSRILIQILIIYQLSISVSCWSLTSWFQKNVLGKHNNVKNLACDNFYEYACKDYKQLYAHTHYNEMTQQLDYQFNRKLMNYLNNSRISNCKEQNFKDKVFLYYESCTKEKQRNLRKYFKEFKPNNELNWPLLESESETWLSDNKTFDLWPFLGLLQSYGLNNIVVAHQITRNSDNSLDIWLAPAWVDQEYALPNDNILKVLLKSLDIPEPEPIIEQLNDTQLKWQELGEEYSETNGTQEIKYSDLAEAYPQLNLSLYLENLLGKEVHNINKITLDDPNYFEYLNQKTWSNEDLEHLCNYLMAKFLYYLAEDSTADFKALECVKDVRNKFDLAINFIAYINFFNKNYKCYERSISEIIDELSFTMALHFIENRLKLSNKQIHIMLNKLKAINKNIGNLPLDFTFKTIENYYQNIPNLNGSNYYKNHLLLLKHRFRKTLNFPQKQTHYIITDNHNGAQTSAFYVAQQNLIVIPFSHLQLPLFHYNQSPLKQLSLFGFVLTHELSHAFDTNGLDYDLMGYPLNTTNHIAEQRNFQKSLDCMQQQEPTDEIDERIADLFAVRVAYQTYERLFAFPFMGKWKKEFFLNLAQFFCGSNKLKFIDHDSDPVRLNQIVKNFPEFSEAFKCSKGSPMNPETKCRLY